MPSYILQTNNEYHPGNIQWRSAFIPSAWELSYFPKIKHSREKSIKGREKFEWDCNRYKSMPLCSERDYFLDSSKGKHTVFLNGSVTGSVTASVNVNTINCK